ncbi:MAG TPA: ribosome-associated translation inhibitor RaiA [Anaeromyxobacteraceae bacterium]|nr:ribosome-associated translation inhibitor RaiA [Anaeromyxobacteraceae bacterium]
MNVQIRTRGIPITGGLRSHVERRASFALDRFAERVMSVTVRFADVNGPRGGVDKVCRVEVVLRGAGAVRASDTHADLYVAIDGAFHRVARGVTRALQRERQVVLELLALAAATAKRDSADAGEAMAE